MIQSPRFAGVVLAVASIVLGMTLTLVIMMEEGAKMRPFATSVIILVWMLLLMVFGEASSLILRGKSWGRLRFFGPKMFGVCLWAIPASGLAIELDLSQPYSILFVLVAMICGAKFTSKII